jgi:peptide/nickel transport system permease protein
LKGYRKYFLNKLGWFLVTLVCAFILNFILPRLMPGDPVAAIVSRLAQGMSNATGVQAIYEQYTELFGTNKPMLEQFFIYVRNVLRGDFGFSFSQYPRTVADVLKTSIWWTVCLAVPGDHRRLADREHAGRVGGLPQGRLRQSPHADQYFCQQFTGLWHGGHFAGCLWRHLKWFPTSGGYGFDLIPNFSWNLSGR